MRTTLSLLCVATVLLLTSGPAAARDTLRCGSKIVNTGITMDEVRKFCGEPTSIRVEEVPVRSGNRVTGTTEMHYWTYRRGNSQKPATLLFDKDTLISITYE